MANSSYNSNDAGDNERHRKDDSSHESQIDLRIERLLKTAANDAPEVDQDFLNQLKTESTQAFLDSHVRAQGATRVEGVEADSKSTVKASSSDRLTALQEQSDVPDITLSGEQKPANSRMVTVAIRALAIVLAGLFCWFGWSLLNPVDNSLGAALDRTATAGAMQMKLTNVKGTFDILATHDKIRIAMAEGQYEIGNNENTWTVDEVRGRVQTTPAKKKHFDGDGTLDLLTFFDEIPGSEFAKIRKTVPDTVPVSLDGVECWRYQTSIMSHFGQCGLVSYVEQETGLLRRLELTPLEDDPNRGVATLNLKMPDQPFDESLFVVSERLVPEGRVGKVAMVQGLVSFRPVMHRRWTLVSQNLKLEIGDQIRTGSRGANAVEFEVAEQQRVTVGPDSLVEVVSADCIRLVNGELRVKVADDKSLTLNGPGDEKIVATGSAFYRVTLKEGRQTLSRIDAEPKWLAGFEGTSNYDPTGSLVATIDGRNEPLTVGYHKVNVDIRDQIARTTIEQSFVNHTDARLEGVFYFPLPQDASISGFGMWINGELVEADVVEKQRAREIYETILREKRDPGLLEWTGGNIFKARVFPILAHSEKRIKITYTQVLPRKGNRFVYQYGLRSEMLRQNPLRDLSINVRINSAVPLAKVDCPTHATRGSMTSNSAQIEFSAQEYTPERDLEVTVDVADNAPPIVAVPHRRGDDGYMLLQVTPPDSDSGWQIDNSRAITGEGDPLEMLIIADTSASMNEIARQQQAEFIAALLSLLSSQDRVNIVAADVRPIWLFDDWQSAGDKTANVASDWLAARDSLGWSDLERTFESVLKKTGENTQVIYVGDGMVSTFDDDSVEFVSSLKRLFSDNGTTLHSVSVGSSYESMVLKGISSLGGGSMRQVSGTRTPDRVAAELLGEIAQPAIRDLKVEFEGLRVARVYPETLPNLSKGQQQIVIGRYLPQGDDQQGTVRITGTLNGQPVSWTAPLELKNAESGNSFIPRLWARKHLDYLLNQGATPEVQEQIIGLSEEFHIITPYTSLLVLESDADRVRFNVRRRFRMRDGERFFADGRNNANYELLQKQMRSAGNWRIGIQQQLLESFSSQGRWPLASDSSQFQSKNDEFYFYMGVLGGKGGGIGGGGSDARWNINLGVDKFAFDESASVRLNRSADLPQLVEKNENLKWSALVDRDEDMRFLPSSTEIPVLLRQLISGEKDDISNRGQFGRRSRETGQLRAYSASLSARNAQRYQPSGLFSKSTSLSLIGGRGQGYFQSANIQSLFPTFAAVQNYSDIAPEDWPADVREFVTSLLQHRSLSNLEFGIEVRTDTVHYDDRFGNENSKNSRLVLFKPGTWLIRNSFANSQTSVDWCDGSQRAIVAGAFELGRSREATPDDQQHNPVVHEYDSFAALIANNKTWSARLKDAKEGQQLLVLTAPYGQVVEILVDTTRNTVVSIVKKTRKGEVTSIRTFSDFVKVAGIWWAGKSQTANSQGRISSDQTIALRQLDEAAYASEFEKRTPNDTQILFIEDNPLRTLRSATQAIADRSGTVADHLLKRDWFMSAQQWTKAGKEMDAIKRLAGDRFGVNWLELQIDNSSRRHEETRQLLIDLAGRVVEIAQATGKQTGDAWFLAKHLETNSHILQVQEQLELHNLLRPVCENTQLSETSTSDWLSTHAGLLESSGEMDAGLNIRRQLATELPHNYSHQHEYVERLFKQGYRVEAYQWLDQAISKGPNPESKEFANPAASRWLDWEIIYLFKQKIDLLKQEGRFVEALQACKVAIGNEETRAVTQQIYNDYLKCLVKTDQLERANELVRTWLADVTTLKVITQDVRVDESESSKYARINSAIQFALNGSDSSRQALEPKWVEPLAGLVRVASRSQEGISFATSVLNNHRFKKLDISKTLRGELIEYLKENVETLSSALMIAYYNFNVNDQNALTTEGWKSLVDKLRPRWESAVENRKSAIALFEAEPTVDNYDAQQRWRQEVPAIAYVLNLFTLKVSEEEHLGFLRQQIEMAIEDERVYLASQLFNTLVSNPWTIEHENESYRLINRMIPGDIVDKPSGHVYQLNLLYRWTDAMQESRRALAVSLVENTRVVTDDGGDDESNETEIEKTPAEIAQEQKDASEKSDDQFIEMLVAREMDEATPAWLKTWLRLERHYREVRQLRNLDEVRETCQNILGDQPRLVIPDFENPESIVATRLENALHNRALTTLLYLGSMRIATPLQRDWVSEYIDRGIGMTADDVTVDAEIQDNDYLKRQYALREAADLLEEVDTWKLAKFQWMIAIDQIDDLITLLQNWVPTDDGMNSWRHALALLLAERGEIRPAIKHFELIEGDGELTAGDYTALAGWYLVDDRREDYERAKLRTFENIQEWELQRYISETTRRLRNTQTAPEDMDEDVLFAIRSLMSRSTYPANYVSTITALYDETQDFRVFASMADALLGHSARNVYPKLTSWNNAVTKIRDEATADSILERIEQLRKNGKTPVDLRALDLLESIIERRNAEIENQPGPHFEKAVAAMRRAFERDWQTGERVLMAQWLEELGKVPGADVGKIQRHQLDLLLAGEPQPDNPFGLLDRLKIAHSRAKVLNRYHELAIDDLTAELDTYLKSADEPLTSKTTDVVSTLVSFHNSFRHFAAAEKLLQRLKTGADPARQIWLTQQLNSVYLSAVHYNAQVSFGQGKDLYTNFRELLLEQLDAATTDEIRYQTISMLGSLFIGAGQERYSFSETAKTDLRSFAFEKLPESLEKMTLRYRDAIGYTLSPVQEHLGSTEAIRFFVERFEQQPSRIEFGSRLTLDYIASRVPDTDLPADLDERLLSIVVNELKYGLRTLTTNKNQRVLYHNDHKHFWSKHAQAFEEAAEEIWQENRQSDAHAGHIAWYLYDGLNDYDHAIALLLDAYQRDVLSQATQSTLVSYLQGQDRFEESIDILKQMLASNSQNVNNYTRLMQAYHQTKRPEELQKIWAEADKLFNTKAATESSLAALGLECVRVELFEPATRYLERVIKMRKASQNDATLSNYYVQLSRAQTGLGHLPEAIDAANAAIVVWGNDIQNRTHAVSCLHDVIRAVAEGRFSTSLDGLVEQTDQQESETGQYNYLLRKAIGLTYKEKKQFEPAIAQLRLAVELQPNDREIHDALIDCFDSSHDKSGAVRQLLELAKLNRRDIELYTMLGDRLQDQELQELYPNGSERAYTSMVEMLAAESEGHAALAQIRQSQNRWEDAVRHWQRVAEVRSKEPTGFLRLCEAQIHLKRWAKARQTHQKLKTTAWPSRFGSVEDETRKLGELLDSLN